MSYKILIVDDNSDNRKLITKSLAGNNYEFVEAETGEDAIVSAKTEKPDLILLDVMMPKMDGYEVCKRLRTHEDTAFVPILFISAQGEEEDRIRGLVAGGDDFISKPFSIRELQARIQTHLSRSQAYLDANPSTRLPGGNSLNQKIQECIADGRPFAAGYADLDNFKAYNDAHGFILGDKVIRFTATVVREAISKLWENDDLSYAGHIGGDDFIYLCHPQYAKSIAEEIVTRFGDGRNKFHSQEEIEQGYYVSKDRQGTPIELPLLSISVAIITQRIAHLGELSVIAAEMKHLAKARGGGLFVTDETDTPEEEQERYILVGEGERLRARKIVSEFDKRGFKALVALNGPDLIKEAHRLQPTAIIIGRTLPMIPPHEARDFLAKIPAVKKIPRFSFETIASDEADISAAVESVIAKLNAE